MVNIDYFMTRRYCYPDDYPEVEQVAKIFCLLAGIDEAKWKHKGTLQLLRQHEAAAVAVQYFKVLRDLTAHLKVLNDTYFAKHGIKAKRFYLWIYDDYNFDFRDRVDVICEAEDGVDLFHDLIEKTVEEYLFVNQYGYLHLQHETEGFDTTGWIELDA